MQSKRESGGLMMVSDKYYGRQAEEYDAKRSHKQCWAREQAAVAEFVKHGPVLDCPVGTGRYLSIYKDKGLDYIGLDASGDMIAQARQKAPALEAVRGSILDLPFENKQFGTVVCSRLLPWLYPEDMARAVAELRRVARELIVSIRIGEKGHHEHQGNYTHSLEDFLAACSGLMIEAKRHILSAPDGEFAMYKLRKPTWNDVRRQFDHHGDRHAAILRLIGNWVEAYGIRPVDIASCRVVSEFWRNDRINDLVETMAATPRADGTQNKMITSELPRYIDQPITVFRSQGREAMIDGRRRSNLWRKQPGMYPVLIIEDVSHVA